MGLAFSSSTVVGDWKSALHGVARIRKRIHLHAPASVCSAARWINGFFAASALWGDFLPGRCFASAIHQVSRKNEPHPNAKFLPKRLLPKDGALSEPDEAQGKFRTRARLPVRRAVCGPRRRPAVRRRAGRRPYRRPSGPGCSPSRRWW